MTTFIETPRFPEDTQYNTAGGPVFSVDIVRVQSGREFRKVNRDIALHRYNVNHVKTVTGFENILDYVMMLGGPEIGFRFKDWSDYKSCSIDATPAFDDQVIGTGDGSTATFQLTKTYQPAGASISRVRDINKPVAATIAIGVGGVQSTGSNWTLATDTGGVTFATGAIPTTGQSVTWGGEFDVPVRIDAQEFIPNYQTCNILNFNLPLVEIIP